MGLLINIVFFILVLYLLFHKSGYNNNFVFSFFAFVFFLLSAFRVENFDRDYQSYVYIFNNIDDFLGYIEISIFVIIKFLKGINANYLSLFVIYAFLGVVLKFYTINKLSVFPMVSLLLYFSYSFLLHDLTQIRVNVAIGFMLCSLIPYFDRKYWLSALLFLLGVVFHYSTFVFLIVLFLDKSKMSKIWHYVIPISYIVGLFSLYLYNYFDILQFSYIEFKLSAYEDELSNDKMNIFNSWQLLKIVFAYFIMFKIDYLKQFSSSVVLFMKMYIISISVIPLFHVNPVFAQRLSDIFGISEVFLIPMILFLFKQEAVSRLLIVCYAIAFFFLNVYYINIFNS